jgi:hypothetical protein
LEQRISEGMLRMEIRERAGVTGLSATGRCSSRQQRPFDGLDRTRRLRIASAQQKCGSAIGKRVRPSIGISMTAHKDFLDTSFTF